MTNTTEQSCPEADLWILAGQSNMEGWGFFTETFVPHSRIWSFGADYQWAPAVPPLHYNFIAHDPVHRNRHEDKHPIELLDLFKSMGRGGAAKAAGPGFFFARYLIDRLPHDKTLALLPCAHGGTFLDEWSPDMAGEPGETFYSAMFNRIAASGLKPKGMLWYQGESDTEPGLAATYAERFEKWVARLRADVGIPDLPVLTVQIGRVTQWGDSDGWNRVQEEQRLAAERIAGVQMVSILDGPIGDHIHLGIDAQKMLGERLARVALTEVYKTGDYGRTIRLAGVEPTVDRDIPGVLLRFEGIHGRLISQGWPTGFDVIGDPVLDPPIGVHRTELNIAGPGTVYLALHDLTDVERLGVAYGVGGNPYCNITDEAGMALPAFGRVWIQPPEWRAEPGGWDRAIKNILGYFYPREQTTSTGQPIAKKQERS